MGRDSRVMEEVSALGQGVLGLETVKLGSSQTQKAFVVRSLTRFRCVVGLLLVVLVLLLLVLWYGSPALWSELPALPHHLHMHEKHMKSLPAHLGKESTMRKEALVGVFRDFDLDWSGTVDAAELKQIASKRRELGHKAGEWTDELNANLMRKLDKNGDGVIDTQEFA